MSVTLNGLLAVALSAVSVASEASHVTAQVANPGAPCSNYSSVLVTNDSDSTTSSLSLQRLNADGSWTLATEYDDTTIVVRTQGATLRDQAMVTLAPNDSGRAEVEVYGNTSASKQFRLVDVTIGDDGQAHSNIAAMFGQNELCLR